MKLFVAFITLLMAFDVKAVTKISSVSIDEYNHIFYDEIHSAFLTLNAKNNLGFIPCKKNVAIVNFNNGYYIFINTITLFAIAARVKYYRGRDDYPHLLDAVQQIGEDFPMIGDDTKDSFDFNRIITCFYKHRYGLEAAYPDRPGLVAHLNMTFGNWFEVAQQHSQNGTMCVGIWGFLESICSIKSKALTAVVNVVKGSIFAFGEFKLKIAAELIFNCKKGLPDLLQFSHGFVDYVSISKTVTVENALEFITNIDNRPKVFKLPFGDKTFVFFLRTINKQFVLRFTLGSAVGIDYDIRMVFLPFCLLIFNEQQNMAMYFYKNFVVLLNLKTELIFFGKSNLFTPLQGVFENNPDLVQLTFSERYLIVVEEIKKLVELPMANPFVLSNLVTAIKNGQEQVITQMVGWNNVQDVQLFFGGLFQNCLCSVSDIIKLLIGGKTNSIVASIFGEALALIAITGQAWTSFLGTVFHLNTHGFLWNIFG